jgi:hypothetical protein
MCQESHGARPILITKELVLLTNVLLLLTNVLLLLTDVVHTDILLLVAADWAGGGPAGTGSAFGLLNVY